jgi:Fe-S cluster biogenesis protein NfuA
MCDTCGCGSTDSAKKIEDMADFRNRVGEFIEQIRPQLQMDGGDIALVDVMDTGEVHVQLQGACSGCPHAVTTLKMGVERYMKEQIPEVTCVENIDTNCEQ